MKRQCLASFLFSVSLSLSFPHPFSRHSAYLYSEESVPSFLVLCHRWEWRKSAWNEETDSSHWLFSSPHPHVWRMQSSRKARRLYGFRSAILLLLYCCCTRARILSKFRLLLPTVQRKNRSWSFHVMKSSKYTLHHLVFDLQSRKSARYCFRTNSLHNLPPSFSCSRFSLDSVPLCSHYSWKNMHFTFSLTLSSNILSMYIFFISSFYSFLLLPASSYLVPIQCLMFLIESVCMIFVVPKDTRLHVVASTVLRCFMVNVIP